MGKIALPLILGVLLICPGNLESKHLFIKMGLGLCQNETLEDSWVINPTFYDFRITGPKNISPGFDGTLELIYKFHRNFGLSLGTGFIWKKSRGHTCLSSPIADEFPLGDIEFTPVVYSSITPIYLTGMIFLPISSSFLLNFLGGVGYYFGNFEGQKAIEGDGGAENPLFVKNRLVWKFKCNTQTFGFHVGIGMDLAIAPPLYLNLEFLFRKANFGKHETSVQEMKGRGRGVTRAHIIGETGKNLGGEWTFLYAQKIRIVDSRRDIDYRVMQLDNLGFVTRVGLKFTF